MEIDFFSWGNWDPQEGAVNVFHRVALKVRIGSFDPGTKFDVAILDPVNGILQFINLNPPDEKGFRSEKECWDFKLKFTIKE